MNLRKTSFDLEDLLACAKGKLFGDGNAQLPMPPLLMFDRIVRISGDGGKSGKGEIVAEMDVRPDLWFFKSHFLGDPVMPGCLGLDALWQLLGFFLAWMGGLGKGRALGVGEVKFKDMVLPNSGKITYQLEIKRLIMRRLSFALADGLLRCRNQVVFHARDLKVGLLTS